MGSTLARAQLCADTGNVKALALNSKGPGAANGRHPAPVHNSPVQPLPTHPRAPGRFKIELRVVLFFLWEKSAESIYEKVTPPADWKTFRSRWDLLHRWRVVLLTIAFAFLIVGVVSK